MHTLLSHWDNSCNIRAHSPSGGHMGRQVSGVVEQLIVMEELLGGVVRLHALRADEALHTHTHTKSALTM